jgi:hypothetical protein
MIGYWLLRLTRLHHSDTFFVSGMCISIPRSKARITAPARVRPGRGRLQVTAVRGRQPEPRHFRRIGVTLPVLSAGKAIRPVR